MIGIYWILGLFLLAVHVQSTAFFKKSHDQFIQDKPNLTKNSHSHSDREDWEVNLQFNNPLPFVGETVAFETNGDIIHGTIESVSSHGTNIFVYSGSAQFGGHFHLSYSSGVIVGEVYPSKRPNEDYKYQILPKDSSSNLYTMRAVPRSVYDNDDSPADEYPSLEFEGDAAELRRKRIQSQPHGVTKDRISDQVSADQVGADYNPALFSSNILDVMFIFTPQALASVGGSQSSMEALAALSVQLANEAYANSLLPIRMRMVGLTLVVDKLYVEKGFSVELQRLHTDGDGYFDSEVDTRNSVGADVVVLFVADNSYCGLAYLWATEDMALAVVSTQCPTSVAHETAHNIGCDHDRKENHDYNYSHYNLGYCWDTSAKTCSRSVMAYAGCVTTSRRTNCPRMPYFSSPLVTQGALKRTTGIATSDNARVIREQLSRAVSWRRSKVPGGLITSAQPSAVAVGRCEPVRIKGFRIGTATSTITSVTLNAVPVQRILSQSLDEVEVLVGLSDMAGTGDIVVTTSSGYQTTLAGAFSYQATSGSFVTDFDSGLGTMWVSTGAADWSVVRYCDSEPCNNPPLTGPVVGAGGSGNFLKVQAFEVSDDVASLTATFNLDTTAGGCVEAVTSLSLFYHLWGPHSDLCGSSLTVSMLTVGSAAWTTILTASTVQAQQSDPWLPLQFSFPNPAAVAAIRITADPYSGQATCYYWGSVAVDRINVTKTTTCSKDNCDFITVAPAVAATAMPSRRPTTPAPSTARPLMMAPSSAPTSLLAVVEIVEFECTQTLSGVTAQQFLSEQTNTANFLRTVAAAMQLAAIAVYDAIIVGIGQLNSHQQLRVATNVKEPSTFGLSLTYKVQLRLQYDLRVTDNGNISCLSHGEACLVSEKAMMAVVSAEQLLIDSLISGAFLAALKRVLSSEIVKSAEFGVAPVSISSFSAPVSRLTAVSADDSTTAARSPYLSSPRLELLLALSAVCALFLCGGGCFLLLQRNILQEKSAQQDIELADEKPIMSMDSSEHDPARVAQADTAFSEERILEETEIGVELPLFNQGDDSASSRDTPRAGEGTPHILHEEFAKSPRISPRYPHGLRDTTAHTAATAGEAAGEAAGEVRTRGRSWATPVATIKGYFSPRSHQQQQRSRYVAMPPGGGGIESCVPSADDYQNDIAVEGKEGEETGFRTPLPSRFLPASLVPCMMYTSAGEKGAILVPQLLIKIGDPSARYKHPVSGGSSRRSTPISANSHSITAESTPINSSSDTTATISHQLDGTPRFYAQQASLFHNGRNFAQQQQRQYYYHHTHQNQQDNHHPHEHHQHHQEHARTSPRSPHIAAAGASSPLPPSPHLGSYILPPPPHPPPPPHRYSEAFSISENVPPFREQQSK